VEAHLNACARCFEEMSSLVLAVHAPATGGEEKELARMKTLATEEQVAQIVEYVEQERRQPVEEDKEAAPMVDWGKIREKIKAYLRLPKLQPARGLAFAMLVILVAAAGQGPFRAWRARVNTTDALQHLQKKWFITDHDLRPSGNVERSIFSVPHASGSHETADSVWIELNAALWWDKSNREARHGLVQYFYFTDRLEQADSLLTILLARDSLDVAAWNMNGLTAARKGDSSAALIAFEKALHIKPDYAEAAYNRAFILTQLGQDAVAQEAWLEYLEIDPRSEWSSSVRRRLAIRPMQ
jgi:tetratricopeptide (TPR) repeat protein